MMLDVFAEFFAAGGVDCGPATGAPGYAAPGYCGGCAAGG
jgi:hypothetical protein